MPEDFNGQDLRGRNFKNQDLRGADFTKADLSGAILTKAKLTGANLTKTQALGADFREADILGAKFTDAKLAGAKFIRARAGVPKRWMTLQVCISFVLCSLLDFVGILFAVVFTSYLRNPNFPEDTSVVQYVEMLLIQVIIYLTLACRGFTAKVWTTVVIITIFVALVFAGALAFVILIAGAGAVDAVGVVGSALVAGFEVQVYTLCPKKRESFNQVVISQGSVLPAHTYVQENRRCLGAVSGLRCHDHY